VCYQQAGVGGSGREGVGQAAETESTLALAENVYVNLPHPIFWVKILFVVGILRVKKRCRCFGLLN
jgi:hypothetical protein